MDCYRVLVQHSCTCEPTKHLRCLQHHFTAMELDAYKSIPGYENIQWKQVRPCLALHVAITPAAHMI